MSIIIKKDPDVYVTESEYRKYEQEYREAYMHYSGTPPTLNEYIHRRVTERNIFNNTYGGG